MVKTVSVAQLGHGGASRAVREAQDEPVLISKDNHPAAWIVSARNIARVAAAGGTEPDIYKRTLELVAIDLYRREVLTLGQAAKLANMQVGNFIELCSRLHVPILWEPPGGIKAEVDAFEATFDEAEVGS